MTKLSTFLFLFLFSLSSFAQQDLLNTKVSLNLTNVSVKQVLTQIENQYDLQFSYSPQQILVNSIVGVNSSNTRLDKVLDELLSYQAIYKVKDTYIILKPNPKKDIIISGYISDDASGNGIDAASIYEPITLASSLSNAKGYYRIKLPIKSTPLTLRVLKEDYEAKQVVVNRPVDQKVNFTLTEVPVYPKISEELTRVTQRSILIDSTIPEPLKPTVLIAPVTPIDTIKDEKLEVEFLVRESVDFLERSFVKGKEAASDFFMSTKQMMHRSNFGDSIYRPFQVSLLPMVGTNRHLSPFIANDFSWNILAGYNGSVNMLEIGGVLNVVRENMTGVQISGFTNVVGQQVKGAQFASSFNVNLGSTEGAMIAGGANIGIKEVSGVQIAPVNIALNKIKGAQIGTVNYSQNMTSGVQIGLLNFAYESNGVPIGLFSHVVKGGFRRLEFAYSDLNDTELSYRTGVDRFYTIYSGNFSYGNTGKPDFGLGFGLGTKWNFGNWLSSNLELATESYFDTSREYVDFWHQNFKGSFLLEAKLGKRFALFGGPTYNFFFSPEDIGGFSFGEDNKYLFKSQNIRAFGENVTRSQWLGYRFGLRICNKR